MSRTPVFVLRAFLAAGALALVLGSCSTATVSAGVSVSNGWYGPWGYDNYWYDSPGAVIVGPPIHPRPGPGPGARPIQPMPMPHPMPHPGGGGLRR